MRFFYEVLNYIHGTLLTGSPFTGIIESEDIDVPVYIFTH